MERECDHGQGKVCEASYLGPSRTVSKSLDQNWRWMSTSMRARSWGVRGGVCGMVRRIQGGTGACGIAQGPVSSDPSLKSLFSFEVLRFVIFREHLLLKWMVLRAVDAPRNSVQTVFLFHERADVSLKSCLRIKQLCSSLQPRVQHGQRASTHEHDHYAVRGDRRRQPSHVPHCRELPVRPSLS